MKLSEGIRNLLIRGTTLLLLTMPMLSQGVLIDTTKQKTVLNKKATIAVGNLLKKGEGYENLVSDQLNLVDSLRSQVTYEKKQNFTYEYVTIPSLERLIGEVKAENKYLNDNSALEIQLIKSQLKQEKAKKWNWGLWGIIIGSLATILAAITL